MFLSIFVSDLSESDPVGLIVADAAGAAATKTATQRRGGRYSLHQTVHSDYDVTLSLPQHKQSQNPHRKVDPSLKNDLKKQFALPIGRIGRVT